MALCDGAKIVHAVFDPRVLASLVDFATFICMLESFKIHLIIPKTIKKKFYDFGKFVPCLRKRSREHEILKI